jgi:tripartite-type tricarboxylate transporter receptor subunit TctC
MWKKVSLLILSTLLVGSVAIQSAFGKEYPTKPVEFFCPYSPGGIADLAVRLVAEIGSKYLGQPIIAVNKTGAGGSIAAADVISSKPDGYKIVLLTNLFFATTTKTQKIPFDPNDLIPITNIMASIEGIMVRGDSPWKTLAELLDYAKKNPGTLRWAHAGRGIPPHLNALLIFRKAGVQTIDVPYKGTPEVVSALLGGHVDAFSLPYGASTDHIKAGNIRPLVFYRKRFRLFPDTPCATELGFPDVVKLTPVFGIYFHKDTPQEIKETLFDVFKKTCEDPELRKGIEKIGEEWSFEGPEYIKESIKKAEEIGVPLLKELGLYKGN